KTLIVATEAKSDSVVAVPPIKSATFSFLRYPSAYQCKRPIPTVFSEGEESKVMDYVGTFIFVHKKESGEHSVKDLRTERRRRGSVGELLKSDGTLWKRPWCLGPR